MNLNWAGWLQGLFSAIATGILVVIGVLGAYREPPAGWWKWLLLFLPAIKSFFDYIKQTPPPLESGSGPPLGSGSGTKILSILLVVSLFAFTGCASVSKQIQKFDRSNYNANIKLGAQMLDHWSFNCGFIDGTGATSKVRFPIVLQDGAEARAFLANPAISLGIAEMTEIAKKAKCGTEICWKDEDYYKGFALGYGVRLGVQSAIEVAKLVVPKDILSQYVPWILGL